MFIFSNITVSSAFIKLTHSAASTPVHLCGWSDAASTIPHMNAQEETVEYLRVDNQLHVAATPKNCFGYAELVHSTGPDLCSSKNSLC